MIAGGQLLGLKPIDHQQPDHPDNCQGEHPHHPHADDYPPQADHLGPRYMERMAAEMALQRFHRDWMRTVRTALHTDLRNNEMAQYGLPRPGLRKIFE